MAGPVESPNTLISNQRIRIIDVLSEGPIDKFTPVSGTSGTNPLCSVYFDDIPVLNGDGSPNWNVSGQGFSFQFNSGTSDQQPLVGFEKVEAFVPLPANTRVFLPPGDGTLNGYPKEVVATINTAMYPDAEGVKVTLRFPAVYTVDPTTGDTKAFDISWAVDVSTNNGPYEPLDALSLTDINARPKCTSAYLFTKVYTLPKQPAGATYYEWRIRVRRTTANVMSTNTANEMFVDSVAVISSNTYRYPMTAVVGINMTADQFGTLPTRAYDIRGIKVFVPDGYTPTQYNDDGTITAATYPGIWLGTMSERKWTDNPAWIFYDLVTNKRYGLGKHVRSEWVDKWTLYQIAQYCDEMVDDGKGGLEPRFTCNVAITQTQDAYTLLNNLVSVFRGMLYWANGRIFPVGPEERDAVFNFTNANAIGGAFTYSDTPKSTRSTVCIVKWLDPQNLFRATPERIEDIDGIGKYGYIEKQLTAFATTSRGQAIRAANWFLTVEQVLTEVISFQTDMEGVYLRPGDVFNVYDNFRNNQKQGGRVLGWGTGQQAIYLDKPVTLEPGFTYFLSALVPQANLVGTGDITGSNQISLIRNSQLETRRVLTSSPAANISTLELTSGFSSSLFRGSPWTLSASGDEVTVFDQATPYRCLATSEPRKGVVEIVGVQYSTGINYRVNTTYSVEVSPPMLGDTTPPAPPTGIKVQRVTGLLVNNNFFDYLYVSWSGSPSVNTAYYTLSGQINAGAPFIIQQVATTGVNYTPPQPGTYTFSVAASNANGYKSAFNRVTYVKANTNPLGTTAPLARVVIESGYDPYYIRGSDATYTGYVGTSPTFNWQITLDANQNPVPTAQFITGYRVRLLQLGNESTVLSSSDLSFSGANNTRWTLDPNYLYTGTTVRPLRGFTISVDTVDQFGNVQSGARLAVNNPQLPPPQITGFVGYNGGFIYEVTPRPQADTSGIYIWVNGSPSFTPTYDNVTFRSTNLAGNVNAGPEQGSVYKWFALVDSFGFSGSNATNGDSNARIYGPISGNTNEIVKDLFELWDIGAISGTLALVTGLNYTFTGASGAQATMINGIIAAISGTYAKIKIVADAFVTGGLPGGIDNAAVARYGFQLDANGKVVSMVATSNSFPGSFGTIVFGNADLQSNTFSAGSDGWRIRANGDVEFNNGVFRGQVAINSGDSADIRLGRTIDGLYGLSVGERGGDFGHVDMSVEPNTLFLAAFRAYNPDDTVVATLGWTNSATDGGILALANGNGNTNVSILGDDGWIRAQDNTLTRAFLRGSDGLISGQLIDVGGKAGAIHDRFGGIRYSGGKTNIIGFYWNGSELHGVVDGIDIGVLN